MAISRELTGPIAKVHPIVIDPCKDESVGKHTRLSITTLKDNPGRPFIFVALSSPMATAFLSCAGTGTWSLSRTRDPRLDHRGIHSVSGFHGFRVFA